MESHTIVFDLFPKHHLKLFYFEDVSNASQIRQSLHDGLFECSMIDAELILDLFQLHTAANLALLANAQDLKKTKGICSEFVYHLSSAPQISKAFATFGIKDTTKRLIVGIFDANPETDKKVFELIHGKSAPFSNLSDKCDRQKIQQTYDIGAEECALSGGLLSAIVHRISTKDFTN